jgi:hypothetical protein
VPSTLPKSTPADSLVSAWLIVGYFSVISILGSDVVPLWLHRIWWSPVVVLGLGSATLLFAHHREFPTDARVSPEDVYDLASLQVYAERKLRSIRYQMRHTSGWSGKLSMPMGSESSRSTSIELSSQPMAYPEVVNDFRAFLECTTTILRNQKDVSPIPVAVILDELDKITPAERVQEFLNEVKALFALDKPGCLFLVSVSEDALALFERRGLPVRDAFDSTFDTILRVEYLNFADAARLLHSRVVRLSAPFVCLSYCLSGGLPRELVRYAREVVNEPHCELAEVSYRLVEGELCRKASVLEIVVARHVNLEPFASNLVSFVNSHTTPAADELLQALSEPPPVTLGADLGKENESLMYLVRLQAETLSHMYYCATLLEVFSDLTEAKFTEDRHQTGDGSFDALASVRRQFSINARLAWMTLSRFRQQWGLAILEPPPVG